MLTLVFIALISIEIILPIGVATIMENRGADQETIMDAYNISMIIDSILLITTVTIGIFVMF